MNISFFCKNRVLLYIFANGRGAHVCISTILADKI